jgi:hypothetical protein
MREFEELLARSSIGPSAGARRPVASADTYPSTRWRVQPEAGEVVMLVLTPAEDSGWRIDIHAPEGSQMLQVRRWQGLNSRKQGWVAELADEGLSDPVATSADALVQFWASLYRRWPGCAVTPVSTLTSRAN